jgi:hypothetical protein
VHYDSKLPYGVPAFNLKKLLLKAPAFFSFNMSSNKNLVSALSLLLLAGGILATELVSQHKTNPKQSFPVHCSDQEVAPPEPGWQVYRSPSFGIQLYYPATLVLEDEHVSSADISWSDALIAQFSSPGTGASEYITLGVNRLDGKSSSTDGASAMTINGIPSSKQIYKTEIGDSRSFEYQPKSSHFGFELSLTADSDMALSSEFTKMAESFQALIPKCAHPAG